MLNTPVASPLTSTTPTPDPPRPAQPNVFARLQALFPGAASPSTSPIDPNQQAITSSSDPPHAKFLKIRIVTWNMHETLPKGDLVELLGSAPVYDPSAPKSEDVNSPSSAQNADHPYHLIIVAAQECPSASGMPLALGAGFHIREFVEKEKERLKEKDKDKLKEKEKVKDPDQAAKQKDRMEFQKRSSGDSINADAPGTPHGWTGMIEDWLCYGNAPINTSSPTGETPSLHVNGKPLSNDNANVSLLEKKQKAKGHYQLLMKERMMGLYMAVFIHRDIRHLVEGTSRSAVTTGLIGGRVGNKGGVGISLKIDGATFLFINAHLAAHEGKLHHRLANWAKIKAELTVDDFLKADDSRMMAEDITDKFDYTFLFGDLNFRLDISRLHADWLISRQEYSSALAFDQLRNIMQNGHAFDGFHEAPINFSPTYKYDVLRTIKKLKKRSKGWRRSTEKIDEIEERETGEAEEEDEPFWELVSDASTVATPGQAANPTTEGDSDYLMTDNNTSTDLTLAQGSAKVLKRASLGVLASQWVSKWRASKSRPLSSLDQSTQLSERIKQLTTAPSSLEQGQTTPPPRSLSASSQKGDAARNDSNDETDRGVYDSSSKKRVPSWCDRIIWKSTVKPETTADEEEQGLTGARSRLGQFIAFAFRNRLRARSSSSNFPPAVETSAPKQQPAAEQETDASLQNVLNGSPALPPIAEPDEMPSLLRSKSVDSSNSDLMPRSVSLKLAPRTRRSSIASSPSRRPRSVTVDPTIQLATPNKDSRSGPSIWRLLPFIMRDANQNDTPLREDTQPKPRKGDIICLGYTTLDDQGMRRLEGRSDHRPVIGSYAAYT